MGKTPKKAAPGGDERNLYNRRLKATTAPSNPSETSLHKRQRESEISNRFVKVISPTNSKFIHSFSVQFTVRYTLPFYTLASSFREWCKGKKNNRSLVFLHIALAAGYLSFVLYFFAFKYPEDKAGQMSPNFGPKIVTDVFLFVVTHFVHRCYSHFRTIFNTIDPLASFPVKF